MRIRPKSITIGCPKCGRETMVTNSRGNGFIRMRERECKECGFIFMTKEEIIDLPQKESVQHYLNRFIAEMGDVDEQRAV